MLAALGLFLLVSVPALAASDGSDPGSDVPKPYDGPPQSAAFDSSLDDEARKQAQAERERQAEWQTPRAKAERDASETKYADDSAGEAKTLVGKEFGSDLRDLSPDAADLSQNGRISGFLDDFTMRVEGENGRPDTVVQAPIALRAKNDAGTDAPVDESLKADSDSYAPRNAVVDVDVPKQAGEGIAIGDSGVRVSPDASGPNPSNASLLGDDKLFYANTDADTDTVVAPVTTGVELFSQLRSKDSPELQRLRLSLPAGAELRPSENDGAEVVRNGRLLARIHAPLAKDAQGQEVPASLRVNGSSIDVVARHRDADFAYPILVDPVIENWLTNGTAGDTSRSWYYGYNLQGLSDWTWEPRNSTAYLGRLACSTAIYSCFGPGSDTGRNDGLHVYARPNTAYPAGTGGRFIYTPPGQSTVVVRADLGPSYYRRGTTALSPYIYHGIFSQRNGTWAAGGQPSYNVYNGPGYDAQYSADFGGYQLDEGPDQVMFGIATTSPFNLAEWRSAYVGGAYLTLSDPESARITDTGRSGPTGWTNSAPLSVHPTVTDPGLGVKTVKLTVPKVGGSVTQTRTHPCTGRASSPCPASWFLPDSPPLTYTSDDADPTTAGNQPMPEGINTVRMEAQDIAHPENPAVSTWQVKVDRSAPTVELGGPLYDTSSDTTYSGEHQLWVDATDESDGTPRSGVRSIAVEVDGARRDYVEQECPDGSCPLDRVFSFNPEEEPVGLHTVRVIVTDFAGNMAIQTFGINSTRESAPPETPDAQPIDESPFDCVVPDPEPGDDIVDRVERGNWTGGPEVTQYFVGEGYAVTRCGQSGDLVIQQTVGPVDTPDGATALVPLEEATRDAGGDVIQESGIVGDPSDPEWADVWQQYGDEEKADVIPPTE